MKLNWKAGSIAFVQMVIVVIGMAMIMAFGATNHAPKPADANKQLRAKIEALPSRLADDSRTGGERGVVYIKRADVLRLLDEEEKAHGR